MNGSTGTETRSQRVGGAAALYLALAYIAAMPYFLLAVDYPGARTVADKVALVVGNYASMYAMYLVTYVFFGIVLGVLVFALYDRFRPVAPSAARIMAAVGLLWAVVLVASGMVFNHGMTTVVGLARTDMAQARAVWLAIEPVAQGLGGAGGELLGGLWVLLVSGLAIRSGALPRSLGWFGVLIGAAGMLSTVPPRARSLRRRSALGCAAPRVICAICGYLRCDTRREGVVAGWRSTRVTRRWRSWMPSVSPSRARSGSSGWWPSSRT